LASKLLVRFHYIIVDITWSRGFIIKTFYDKNENESILCLLEVKMLDNLFEIRNGV